MEIEPSKVDTAALANVLSLSEPEEAALAVFFTLMGLGWREVALGEADLFLTGAAYETLDPKYQRIVTENPVSVAFAFRDLIKRGFVVERVGDVTGEGPARFFCASQGLQGLAPYHCKG